MSPTSQIFFFMKAKKIIMFTELRQIFSKPDIEISGESKNG